MHYLNHPFADVVKQANRAIDQGGVIYQKFTCANCGSRQTIDVPNTFYTEGSCEECHHITNLQIEGCNYMVIFGPTKVKVTSEEIKKEQERSKKEVKARGVS